MMILSRTILCIAGHGPLKGGGFDSGATGYITQGEHKYYRDTMFPLMKKYVPKGSKVIFHSAYNVYSYGNIVSLANSYGKDTVVVEFHFDAWKSNASGGHVIVQSNKTPDKYDKAIRDVIKKHIGLANRTQKGEKGIDGRSDFLNPNACYRAGVNYRMVELGFGTNRNDSTIMLDKADAIAKDLVQAICGESQPAYSTKTPIAGQKPTVTIEQMEQWAKNNKANQLFVDLASTFYDVALGRKLDPALLYAQSAKETALMNFGGVLDASFKNPCGLKTRRGGGNYDPNAHQRFTSWEQGIKAQADHLNLYAGAEGYPMPDSPDPRHFSWIKGTAKTVEELGGKWAGAYNYGTSIVDRMKQIQAIKVDPKKIESVTVEEAKPKTFDYAVVYAHANDRDSAEFLANYLDTQGYSVIDMHTEDATDYAVGKVIQVGGREVKGSDIKLAGQNEAGTAEEVMKYMNKIERKDA